MAVAAGICEMAGYQAVDIGANGLAQRYYLLALEFAQSSGDRAYGAHLTQAEAAFGRSSSADEPGWIAYFSPADLEEEAAHCMHDLGQHAQAQLIVRTALADMDPSRVRRLAIDTALLATSLANDGQVEEACSIGRRAVEYAARTNSFRSVIRINDMRAALTRFASHPAVVDLEEPVRHALPRRHS
jgi:tetratricopeptide (TPR) repeat protein